MIDTLGRGTLTRVLYVIIWTRGLVLCDLALGDRGGVSQPACALSLSGSPQEMSNYG